MTDLLAVVHRHTLFTFLRQSFSLSCTVRHILFTFLRQSFSLLCTIRQTLFTLQKQFLTVGQLGIHCSHSKHSISHCCAQLGIQYSHSQDRVSHDVSLTSSVSPAAIVWPLDRNIKRPSSLLSLYNSRQTGLSNSISITALEFFVKHLK